MHFLSLRERGSKIYAQTVYNIPMDNDRSHINISYNKVEETKVIQEKRQIDKIMHGVIKERLFSHFIDEDTRISEENYMKITGIGKKGFLQGRFRDRHRPIANISKTIQAVTPRKTSLQKKELTFNTTIQCFPSSKQAYSIQNPTQQKENRRQFQSESRQRRESMRLPDLQRADTAKTIKLKGNFMAAHRKKVQFNERAFYETFRRWAGAGPQVLINEIRLNKQAIISKLKNVIDSIALEKFFYFFGFPQQFTLRQYGNLIQNAANCSLRFIYFWMFIILDENSNGVLTSQDLFRLLQRYPQNEFIQEEIFALGRHLQKLEKSLIQKNQVQAPVEESLTVNRNLRMQELKDILKQSTKQRIDVNCVKNTCYHQTILSLEHDTLERAKLNQIQNNQVMTKMMKQKQKEQKKKLVNLVGLRLRDFPYIFCGKRPKIFCYVLHLLAGINPNQYE